MIRYGLTDLVIDDEVELSKYVSIHDKDGYIVGEVELYYIEEEQMSIKITGCELGKDYHIDSGTQIARWTTIYDTKGNAIGEVQLFWVDSKDEEADLYLDGI